MNDKLSRGGYVQSVQHWVIKDGRNGSKQASKRGVRRLSFGTCSRGKTLRLILHGVGEEGKGFFALLSLPTRALRQSWERHWGDFHTGLLLSLRGEVLGSGERLAGEVA